MTLRTYADQHPMEIRRGDTVKDKADTYTATADVVFTKWLQWQVMGNDSRWHTYEESDKVTITALFDEDDY